MKKYIYSLLVAAAVLWGCTPEDAPVTDNGNGTSAGVEDKASYTVKGVVSCDGTPLSGVVISDGKHFATTDLEGRYWLKSSAEEDIVFCSIPSGYEVPVENGWEPKFWYPINQEKLAAGEVQQFDFDLVKVDNTDFRLMVLADIHIRGRHESIGIQTIDSVQFIRDVRPAIQQWCNDNRGVRQYCLVLGDMVQDSYIVKHGAGLPQYKALLRQLGLQMFHLPGNHDYGKGNFGTVQTDPEGREIKAYYREHLGPTYYSFNLGKVHFVMLDGTTMTGPSASKYENKVSPRQIEWLQGDLLRAFDTRRADMPERLVICCHQPFLTNGGNVLSNSKEIMKTVASCNIKEATVFSGHIHFSDIVNNRSINSVRFDQYSHTALCGPFWIQRYNWDDSPNGWTEYTFSGADFTRKLKGFDPEYDTQAIFYTDDIGDATDSPDSLIINVPAYETGWTVKVQKNQGTAETLSPIRIYAPNYHRFYLENLGHYTSSHNINPRKSSHFFAYEVKDPTAEYTMLVTAPDGTEYKEIYPSNN